MTVTHRRLFVASFSWLSSLSFPSFPFFLQCFVLTYVAFVSLFFSICSVTFIAGWCNLALIRGIAIICFVSQGAYAFALCVFFPYFFPLVVRKRPLREMTTGKCQWGPPLISHAQHNNSTSGGIGPLKALQLLTRGYWQGAACLKRIKRVFFFSFVCAQ